MNESAAPRSRRLAVVILGGLTSIVLGALVVLAATHGRITASFARNAGRADPSHGARARGIGYQPRVPVETSGFFELLGRLPRWAPDATLEQIAAVWRDTPRQAIAAIDEELKSTDLPDTKKVERAFSKAVLYVAEGDIDRASKVLEETRSWVEKDDALSRAILYTIIFNQGVLALRRGETDNCVMCRGESSCILPIAPAAIHTNPAGSRLAIKHFSDYLDPLSRRLGRSLDLERGSHDPG